MKNFKLPVIDFTGPGYDRLKQEFDQLTARRPGILAGLQAAREMGDLSENGAYKAARFELGDLDRRLRKVTYLLRVARVTESKKDGSIDFGSQVTLADGRHEFTFMLVNEHEADPGQKKLSVKSPYGQAVIGKRTGDRVIVHAPSGDIVFTVAKVN